MNRPRMLARAGRSVLAQTYKDWEWIVLDVGTERIAVESVPDDPRVMYFWRPPNEGPARDFQRALNRSGGEIVHPLSDDDELVPEALETVAREIGDAEWLVGLTHLLDVDGVPWAGRGGDYESFTQTMNGEYMLGGAVYWRRSLTDRVGGFDPRFDSAADMDLYMRFGRAATPKIIPDLLYLYHDHPETDSRVNGQKQSAQVRRVRAHHGV